jgi:methyl coenzyme M reductase subunit D
MDPMAPATAPRECGSEPHDVKFLRPYDCPDSALRALQEIREDSVPFPYNLTRHGWLRRMVTMSERRLSRGEQVDAVEQRVKLHLIAERLRS